MLRKNVLIVCLVAFVVALAPAQVSGAPLKAPAPLKLSTLGAEPAPNTCGSDKVALVFKNPDLQANPQDGKVYASARFFAQFQAIGEDAMKIERFAFSFGKPVPPESRTCDTPRWITGAYIVNYRIDYDPRDGFFMPINTSLVPDGEYGAAVHAYDSSGTEIARYYVEAIVDNGGRQSTNDPPLKDFVQPWPLVLPGDGEQTRDVGGLTIEFAEEIKFLEVRIDGVLIGKLEDGVLTGALQEWTPPSYDDDAAPDDTPIGRCPTEIVKPMTQRMGCRVWGPGFHWPGQVQDGQVIEVKAIDMWDNMANKVLHLGDPTIGGRISLLFPEVEIIGSGQQKTADTDGKAVYPFQFKASGEGGLHGNIVFKDLPQNLTARFTKNHIMVKSGTTMHSNLTVQALPGLAPGTYEVKGQVIYEKGTIEEYKDFTASFVLAQAATEKADEKYVSGNRVSEEEAAEAEKVVAETNTTPPPPPPAETPGFGVALLLAALGALAALYGRGRRD